jgi:hypothetical protein
MAGGFRLTRLPPSVPIVSPDTGKPSNNFVLWWQSVCEQIEANENAQNDLISQLQAALALAGGAVTETDAAGTTAKSGQTTTNGLTVDSATWVPGPTVALSGVTAGMTQLILTGSGPLNGTSSGGPMDGEYRIVEVVGITETVIYTGSFTVRTLSNGSTIINLTDPVNNQTFTRSATGAVSYRLDLRRKAGAGIVTGLSAYLFARRYP